MHGPLNVKFPNTNKGPKSFLPSCDSVTPFQESFDHFFNFVDNLIYDSTAYCTY